jgi:predicted transcriptional regulator
MHGLTREERAALRAVKVRDALRLLTDPELTPTGIARRLGLSPAVVRELARQVRGEKTRAVSLRSNTWRADDRKSRAAHAARKGATP